ncbi:MAG: chitobiase/beta-hexosaminidase C-terminal domain-containing protein [Kiritimatiellae bacterium]|nr:chitobiase/beta-hexosaminidase C-terminal domain-containing protein [Kiritimatiellia bacterium]
MIRKTTTALLVLYSVAWSQAAFAQSVTDLASGQLIEPVTLPRFGHQFYRLVVPAGASRLVFASFGGTGDADLYVRRGGLPNGKQFDARSMRPGNAEWVDLRNPPPGEWYLLIFAKTAVSRAKAWAVLEGTPPSSPAVAPPVFSPPAGMYTGSVRVVLGCATPGAVVRATTDGSDPHLNSPAVQTALVSATTTLRARAFVGSQSSAVASARYEIVPQPPQPPPSPPAAGVIELVNGQVLRQQSNPKHKFSLYRLVVPNGPTHLVFGMTGGAGDADMYVRHGAPPSLTQYDYRPYKPGNTELVQVMYPAAGEWYLMIYARAAYHGLQVWGIHWRDATLTTVATPTIQPAGGTFRAPVEVRLSCTTPGATIRYTLDGSPPTLTSPTNQPFILHQNTVVSARAFRDDWTPSAIATATFHVNTNAPPAPGLPPLGRIVDLERFSWTPLDASGTKGVLTVPLRWAYRFVNLSGDYSRDLLGVLQPRTDGTYLVNIQPRTKLIVQLPGLVRPDPALPKQSVVLEYSFDPRVPQNLRSARVLHYSYRGVWSQFRDWQWLTRGSAAPHWNGFELIKRW